MKFHALPIGLVVLLLVGCGDTNPEGRPRSQTTYDPSAPAAAEPSGDVTLQSLTYDEIQELIASHKGKVVVMDAWSTSCPPCIQEFPNLVAMHRDFGPEKLAAISLSFDYEGLGKPEEVKPPVLRFLQDQKATFDNVLNAEESDVLYEKMDLDAVPAVYVYDQQGELVQRFDSNYRNAAGERFTYKDVRALVEGLLAGKS